MSHQSGCTPASFRHLPSASSLPSHHHRHRDIQHHPTCPCEAELEVDPIFENDPWSKAGQTALFAACSSVQHSARLDRRRLKLSCRHVADQTRVLSCILIEILNNVIYNILSSHLFKVARLGTAQLVFWDGTRVCKTPLPLLVSSC